MECWKKQLARLSVRFAFRCCFTSFFYHTTKAGHHCPCENEFVVPWRKGNEMLVSHLVYNWHMTSVNVSEIWRETTVYLKLPNFSKYHFDFGSICTGDDTITWLEGTVNQLLHHSFLCRKGFPRTNFTSSGTVPPDRQGETASDREMAQRTALIH